jgi:hypothetical protein
MLRNESVMKAQRRYKKTLAPPSYTYTNTALAKPKHMMDSAHTNKTSAKPLYTNTSLPSYRLHSTFPLLDEVEDSKSDAKDTEYRKQKAKKAQRKIQLRPWNSVGR